MGENGEGVTDNWIHTFLFVFQVSKQLNYYVVYCTNEARILSGIDKLKV